MPAGGAPPPVGGDERHDGGAGRLNPLGDELGDLLGETAEPALLPARDEPLHRRVVHDGRAGAREAQPPARALEASLHGPRRRRTASVAERSLDARQAVAARDAELRALRATDEAPPRQQQVEQAYGSWFLARVNAPTGTPITN
jgi:hypothetical protein